MHITAFSKVGNPRSVTYGVLYSRVSCFVALQSQLGPTDICDSRICV